MVSKAPKTPLIFTRIEMASAAPSRSVEACNIRAVRPGVGVAVGVGVGVGEGVAVAVAVGLGVKVAVGVGV